MTLGGERENITPNIILKTFKNAIGFCRPNLGFEAKEVYNCFLRAADSITLICSGVDSDVIKLIGC